MPYCPKCDMEFVEGVTVCTDCGGRLVESKEVADAMKEEELKKQEELMREQYEKLMATAEETEGESDENAPKLRRTAPSKAYGYDGGYGCWFPDRRILLPEVRCCVKNRGRG